jgi:hypothetical protein
MTTYGSLLYLALYRFSPNSQQINDIVWKSAMPFTVSIFTELTTDQWQCMGVCYAFHCLDFHLTLNRSMTMYGSLIRLALYRFSLNSQQINDIAWKSATPGTISIFTELTTDQWHCMEVCYAFRCIDFHRTHNRSMTLHGSLLCLSLYRFSPNSQQINDTAWKSAMPVAVSIFTELTADQWKRMEVCYAEFNSYRDRNAQYRAKFPWRSSLYRCLLFNITTCRYSASNCI